MKIKFVVLFVISLVITLHGCKNTERPTSEEEEMQQVEAVIDEPESCMDILKKHDLYKEDMNARDLNNAGFELYKQKLYSEAIIVFRCALEEDEDHLYANYNLACTLSLLKDQGVDVSILEIFMYLEKSLLISPTLVAQARQDEDLEYIRVDPRFAELIDRVYKEVMIRKIYPDGEFKVYDQFVGDQNIKILTNIRLTEYDGNVYVDNKKRLKNFVLDQPEYGFIPLNRVHFLNLEEDLAAMAYEIYLC